MKIFHHDFAGHPFQFQLSRELARRGYEVVHAYCASLITNPQAVRNEPIKTGNLKVKDISLGEKLLKYRFIKRWFQERKYGILLTQEVKRESPDIVLSGNAPLDVQLSVFRVCKELGIKFIFWVQDLWGIGIYHILRKKIPGLGCLIGQYYITIEKILLKKSDAIILITEEFYNLVKQYGLESKKIYVIPNWAPLEEIPMLPKENEWAKKHGLNDKFCFLYSGTLGLKHNPELLVQLANHFKGDPRIQVVVISQGLGADYLRKRKKILNLRNLIIMDFQPYEQVPQVFATADVLVALLERDASIFSVPSKVLAYLCAGRPLLLAVPPENFAARIIRDHEAGLVVSPDDVRAFIEAANLLVYDSTLREYLGKNAREYAETHFNIYKIADIFEQIFKQLITN